MEGDVMTKEDTLLALHALLLHPPAGASDAEMLAAARVLLRNAFPD